MAVLNVDDTFVKSSGSSLSPTLHPIIQPIEQYPMALTLSNSSSACSAAAIPYPDLYGANFLSLEANLVTDFSKNIHIGYYTNHGGVSVVNATYCNVTMTYTHPGENDTVEVQVFLPHEWNGRMQHIGGAGFQAGLHDAGIYGMLAAMGEGYASVGTNAGLGSDVDPSTWGLVSEGNVNLYLLQNLATVSLHDASVIGKDVVNSYYGEKPAYSYFSGCSQGGRQGHLLAQRYPEAYDGIAASAPAINWNKFFVGDYYPAMLMNEMGEYPAPCEFDAITTAMVAACDPLDGVTDSVITDPASCDFDPSSMVGKLINCTDTGSTIKISEAAANITKAVYDGPRSVDGDFLWYGLEKGSLLTSVDGSSLVPTSCSTTNGTCSGSSSYLMEAWIKYFVLKNSTADLSTITHKQLDRIFHQANAEYNVIDTSNPDLSAFRERGGKMLSYHGLADTIIPTNGSVHYYESVMALDKNVQDYYRLFLAPGLSHCFGGYGAYPDGTFDAMRKWVEEGIAPDTLNATTVTEPIFTRPLCPYPQQQYYNGTGDSSTGEGFYCA